MSARSDLAGLIAAVAPLTWTVHPAPVKLTPLDDADKPVAVVVEQRAMVSGTTSPDQNGIPVQVELTVWVIVDGARGEDLATIEDQLEDAAEEMIRILEPMPNHVWDGTATRDFYDEQKPAYQFTIRASGAITGEDDES